MQDPWNLERFVRAQDADRTYDAALGELRAGRKSGHWMWFVFPQLAGLGRSSMAQEYGVAGMAEARAYLAHPVLGPRLVECAQALCELSGRDADAVLGGIDAIKLRSSMTLFAAVGSDQPVYQEVLDQYFVGRPDPLTLDMLGAPPG